MTLEDIIVWMQSLSPLLVYTLVFAIAFIENVFPPSPSDTIIVFGGSLVGLGNTGFLETLLAATLGSTLGFMTMYQVGKWFGARILEQRKVQFIPASSVQTVGEWFRKYGYWLIIGNRFLSGTRAVVSFFAGMSKLNLSYTTALCFLSALAWNGLLVTAGFYLGKNWERIGFYLSTYSQVVTGILIVGAVVLIARFLAKKNGKNA